MGVFARASLLLACTVHFSAVANHETPPQILGQFQHNIRRLHVLKPSPSPRQLVAAEASAVSFPMRDAAKAITEKAFSVVLIENGAILLEAYGLGASTGSPLSSQSVAKSLTALSVGEAFCSGKIKNLEDPAYLYAPQIKGTAYGDSSIRNLLRYTSGAKDPGGSGFTGIHSETDLISMFRHELSLADLMTRHGGFSVYKPGEKFIYNGLDSEALSLVIRGATGKSMPAWFEETVWQKSAGQYQAGWYLDKDGNGVGQMLVYMTTRDFARVGLYVLDHLAGTAPNKCMVEFIQASAKPLVEKANWVSAPFWGMGLHIGLDGNVWFFGHGSQRVGIDVKNNRVIAVNGYAEWRGSDVLIQSLLRMK